MEHGDYVFCNCIIIVFTLWFLIVCKTYLMKKNSVSLNIFTTLDLVLSILLDYVISRVLLRFARVGFNVYYGEPPYTWISMFDEVGEWSLFNNSVYSSIIGIGTFIVLTAFPIVRKLVYYSID